MEHHAGSDPAPARMSPGPDWHDALAMAIIVGVVVLLVIAIRPMLAPFTLGHQPALSLAPSALPYLVVDTERMHGHIEAAARSVDKEVGKTWFAPSLAAGASQLARTYLSALRAEFPSSIPTPPYSSQTGMQA